LITIPVKSSFDKLINFYNLVNVDAFLLRQYIQNGEYCAIALRI